MNLVGRKAALLKQAGQLHDVDADGFAQDAPAIRSVESIHSAVPTTLDALDREIELQRSKDIIDHERLSKLYGRKAQLMKARGLLHEIDEDGFTNHSSSTVAVKTSPIPVTKKLTLGDIEDAITRERSKEFTDPDVLMQLYSQKAEHLKAAGKLTEPDPDGFQGGAPAKDGVVSALQDQWGDQHELKSYELYHNVRSAFGDNDQRLNEVIGQLPEYEQIAIADSVDRFTAQPITEQYDSAQGCVSVVESQLRDEWGGKYDQALSECQRVARKIWGSIENFDSWCTRTNISRNSDSQVQLMKILNRMARSVK